MIVGIIAAVFVIAICFFAFVLCKAASDWPDDDWRDED